MSSCRLCFSRPTDVLFFKFVNNVKRNVTYFFMFYVTITVFKPGCFLVRFCTLGQERYRDVAGKCHGLLRLFRKEQRNGSRTKGMRLLHVGPDLSHLTHLDEARTKMKHGPAPDAISPEFQHTFYFVWARSQKEKSRNTF